MPYLYDIASYDIKPELFFVYVQRDTTIFPSCKMYFVIL